MIARKTYKYMGPIHPGLVNDNALRTTYSSEQFMVSAKVPRLWKNRMENNPLMYSRAAPMESLRKRIHARHTNMLVLIQPIAFHTPLSRFINSGFSRSHTTHNPCRMPQTTKVQFAPCHRPLSANTTMVLMAMRSFPFLLPPIGIYTYVVKNLPRVMCHLRQNSRTEQDL